MCFLYCYFVSVLNPFSTKHFLRYTRTKLLFSVKQRHRLSQARGSSTPVMTTTLQIHSTSQMSLTRKRQGTLLTSPIRTQTSSLTQNPQSPGRGKECDLLTWASTCMLTTFTMKMRSLTSKTSFLNEFPVNHLLLAQSMKLLFLFSTYIQYVPFTVSN